MSLESEELYLSAQVQMKLMADATRYQLHPSAIRDVAARILAEKPEIRPDGSIRFPGGRDLPEFLDALRFNDGGHLFAQPPEEPKAPDVDAAKLSAKDRLRAANGEALKYQWRGKK